MVNCDSLKAALTKTHNFSQTMPMSRRAWVHYGRKASSTTSCISCSKRTGWQTNYLSLQALRLTNKVISAFSGHKQGKFVRKGFEIVITHNSIKVFITHILVLLWLNSSFNWNSTANLTNRENFREKFQRKIRVEQIFAQKIGPNYSWTRTTARKFVLTKNGQRENSLNFFRTFALNKTLPFFVEKPRNSRISSNYALITFAQYCTYSEVELLIIGKVF